MLFCMPNFFNTHKQTYVIWAIFLSLAIVCAQSVKLHVHDMDHTHKPVELVNAHSHDSEFHLSVDSSHAEYHHQVKSEMDLGLKALLKDISGKVLLLALLVTVIAYHLHRLFSPVYWCRPGSPSGVPWRYRLGPPLRAPPL